MNDGNRQYPVNYYFLHHSTGPNFVNASDLEVQDWYSNTGKARGYNNGAINPHHEHPSRPGTLTYAMAQFTLREYNLDGNKYGYRLTDLIARPWANVAWAVGNWDYNIKSSSLEICGNFLNKILPDKALMCIADFLRIIDKELVDGGYPGGINVWLHQEVKNTACPARIKEQRDTIIDMINNPAEWNAILWPVAPPAPVITTKDIIDEVTIPYESQSIENNAITLGERRLIKAGISGKRTITTRITLANGVETSRSVILDETIEPVTEVYHVGTYVAPVVVLPPTPQPTEGEDAYSWLSRVLVWIKELLKKFKFNK